MPQNLIDKDELIRQLMADRDRLFRENSRLRTATNIAPEEMQQVHNDQLAAKDTLINKKEALLRQKEVRIAQLEKQVDYLKRQLYGGKAERYINPDPQARQLELFEGVDLLPGEKEAATKAEKEIISEKEARAKRMEKAKKSAVRKSLPENLERKIEHLYPEGYNPQDWDLLDEQEPLYTEVLIKEPTKFYVLRTYRHKAIRKSDHLIVTADCPVKPIAKSYASSSLLADLMVDKYVDHIPFYRQHKQFERLGMKIPEPTILGWFQQVSDLLMPLHFRLWELMKKTNYLQCDETTLPVVRNDKHKTVKGYIWLVRDPMSGREYFYWDKGSRSGEVVLKLFNGYQGALQTDGYERYELLDGKKGIILLSCWAHARRKFSDAIKNDRERAESALEQIQLLYEVERQIKDQALCFEEAAKLRVRLAYPIMVRFEKWLVAEHAKVIKGSPIEKAILYTYNRFNKLSRYHLDGRYNIDNNGIENAARPVAVGRKNYLFCQNDTAESTAIIYSFMGCCKAAKVNFRTWMIYFLDHVHDYDQDYTRDIAELLPDNLKDAGVL
ncbi:IS66 family transposase [Bacteroides graminisolvens]|jgi:transposase|uniref:Mobile element protein n=1 Tax=Bacteroides graminisolvens DSM 19988 = JCM 15093 TaxID=1121097 RepID=A0A069D555_9BACE|nr:IS66 family transposase [Bacteroides graminisolvens]GAK37527.1 mobile element protein [Bacteroides graminisolvens DSM 19988 = JCM 15093]HPW71561.1 IS66 family transposase [Bacteroides graminisolvens]